VRYNFGELQKPGCNLRNLAVSVGNRVAADLRRMATNPAAFAAKYPRVASSLARGVVPRGVSGYPLGPLCYAEVPLLGTKHLTPFITGATHRVDLRGVPNFGTTSAPPPVYKQGHRHHAAAKEK